MALGVRSAATVIDAASTAAAAARHIDELGRGLAFTADSTLVAAHRGFHSGIAPYENTLVAFRRAIDQGADMLELDVQRTLDGVLVVHHDPHIGKALISGTKLADLPLLPDGSAVTRMDEVVDLASERGAKLLVELKAFKRGMAVPQDVIRESVDMLTHRRPGLRFEMFSFDIDAMKAVKQLDPTVRTGALFMERPKWLAPVPFKLPTTGRMLRQAQEAGVDFVALRTTLARNRIIQRFADAGLPTYVWTADKPKVIDRLLRNTNVQAVISDRPDVAMSMRESARRAAAAG